MWQQGYYQQWPFPGQQQNSSKFFETSKKKLGSVYFAINDIVAFRSILPQLHNPMSHEYYILFYSTVSGT